MTPHLTLEKKMESAKKQSQLILEIEWTKNPSFGNPIVLE